MPRAYTIKELGFDPRKLFGPDSSLRDITSRARRRGEHDEQVKLFAWAAENESRIPELRWLFAIPNWFGVGTKASGGKAKAEGRKPGVLDVWWPLLRPKPGYESHIGHYSGLVIEMKYGKNTLSTDQRDWQRWLESQGWVVEVCYTFERARDVVLAYYQGGYRR